MLLLSYGCVYPKVYSGSGVGLGVDSDSLGPSINSLFETHFANSIALRLVSDPTAYVPHTTCFSTKTETLVALARLTSFPKLINTTTMVGRID